MNLKTLYQFHPHQLGLAIEDRKFSGHPGTIRKAAPGKSGLMSPLSCPNRALAEYAGKQYNQAGIGDLSLFHKARMEPYRPVAPAKLRKTFFQRLSV